MIRVITFTAAMTCVFMKADPEMGMFWILVTIFFQLYKNGSAS